MLFNFSMPASKITGVQSDLSTAVAGAKTARKLMSAGGVEVIQIEYNGYQVLWSNDNEQRMKYATCAIDKAFKNQVWWKRNQT